MHKCAALLLKPGLFSIDLHTFLWSGFLKVTGNTSISFTIIFKKMGELKAVLFDLDGTLLDNNQVHLDAWKQYLKDNEIELSDEEYKEKISGRTNLDAVKQIYKKEMTEEEASEYYLKKEEIYRNMYEPNIAPIAGLIQFLEDLKKHGITMAIATSGIQVNIDFMFAHVPIKEFFTEVVNSADITRGKPDPEIFTKTAEALQMPAENCIVFEDSIAGVKSGKAAGMKVVALTTTHTPEELEEADLVIKDYTEIDFERLRAIS
ncbi:MAG TPA: HAD family phosphatase [Segetibacter sp.]|jgi:beta-phosphoglucomutase family hydrolase